MLVLVPLVGLVVVYVPVRVPEKNLAWPVLIHEVLFLLSLLLLIVLVVSLSHLSYHRPAQQMVADPARSPMRKRNIMWSTLLMISFRIRAAAELSL